MQKGLDLILFDEIQAFLHIIATRYSYTYTRYQLFIFSAHSDKCNPSLNVYHAGRYSFFILSKTRIFSSDCVRKTPKIDLLM